VRQAAHKARWALALGLGGLGLLVGHSAAANPPRLGLRVSCSLGETCFIQQFVDHAPGPTARDYTCGALSYDGHKGTDFGLPNMQHMAAGVDVLAAAPGRVAGTRDGMPDTGWAPTLAGRECVNGVVIQHADGWETQYCHMKQGSIAVQRGQTVQAGTVLGQVGFSGRTEFPHLHLSVRHDGQVIDPFDADGQISCLGEGHTSLWAMPLPYQPGGLLAGGFAENVPSFDAVKAGTASPTPNRLPRQPKALVFWTHGFGAKPGDQLDIAITAPDGSTFFQTRVTLEKTQAQYFRAAGRRVSAPLMAGLYSGRATLLRAGEQLGQSEGQITIAD